MAQDHVGGGAGEHVDLRAWYASASLRRHAAFGHIAVAARTDAAADHDWSPRRFRSSLRTPRAGGSPGGWPRRARRPCSRASRPSPAGPPRGALEDQAGREPCRDLRIRSKVLAERRFTLRRPEEVKAAKSGSSSPSWKISVVSMPPSVRNIRRPSCGRLSRYRVMCVFDQTAVDDDVVTTAIRSRISGSRTLGHGDDADLPKHAELVETVPTRRCSVHERTGRTYPVSASRSSG